MREEIEGEGTEINKRLMDEFGMRVVAVEVEERGTTGEIQMYVD